VYLPAMFPCDVRIDLPDFQVFQQSGMFQRFIFDQGDTAVLSAVPVKGKGSLLLHGYERLFPQMFDGVIESASLQFHHQVDDASSLVASEVVPQIFGIIDFEAWRAVIPERAPVHPEYPNSDRHDHIILNSTANLQKAIPLLVDYEQVHPFLDNDKAGMTVFRKMEKDLGCRVRNSSHHYSEYKDLNEYLCARAHLKHSRSPKKPVQKPKRGLRI
jgi:hypothetical protein